MRMIIEARIAGPTGSNATIPLAEIERTDGDVRQLGLNLSEGRDLIRDVQRVLVIAQARTLVEATTHCRHCRATLSIKAMRTIQYRTVFGKVTIDSPQLRRCTCTKSTSAASFSPLAQAMPFRVSPELEYLQVKWAAHLPFAVATELLKEILPVDQAISTAGLKNRVRTVGQELDDQVESAIRGEREYPSNLKNNTKITALAVDSAWLRHCAQPSFMGRHVNIIAGRAVRDDGTSRLYGYVNKEVGSATTRLDHFLSDEGVPRDQKITVVSDGAGEFEKAVDGSVRLLTRILDWFHIAMKFRAIEQSVQKFPDLLAPSGRPIGDEITSAKWLTWHGKCDEAVERLENLHEMFDLRPVDPAHRPLWWNPRGTYFYLNSNREFLVNYGWRYRRGMPISSSIAESAVNQVVSLRCAKKRQMRWTDKGAHLLVQVRVAVLNGELTMREKPIPRRFPIKEKCVDQLEHAA